MKKYNVIIDVQSIHMEIEAASEQEALDKAQVKFYHEMAHGSFELEAAMIDDYEEDEE